MTREPQELSPENALEFLAGRLPLPARATARLLGGGVSNTVVLVEAGTERIVLKQALPRLRVRDEWLADRSRVLREWAVLRALGDLLPPGRLPELLFCDRRRYAYAMRAAPAGSEDWKTRLLAGELSGRVARRAGATLGLLVRGTWGRDDLRERFGDQRAFEQLRTDPYYRTSGQRHPRLAGAIEEWIAESSARRVALVHGDWSPKNLLVGRDGLTCIDFECAHYGDPSYDAAFLLNHLVLKAFRRPELAGGYFGLARTAFGWTLGLLPSEALGWYEAAAMRHVAFLMLARVDGKSPAEYLREDWLRDAVRRLALRLIAAKPATLTAVLHRVAAALPPQPAPTRKPA